MVSFTTLSGTSAGRCIMDSRKHMSFSVAYLDTDTCCSPLSWFAVVPYSNTGAEGGLSELSKYEDITKKAIRQRDCRGFFGSSLSHAAWRAFLIDNVSLSHRHRHFSHSHPNIPPSTPLLPPPPPPSTPATPPIPSQPPPAATAATPQSLRPLSPQRSSSLSEINRIFNDSIIPVCVYQ